MGLGKEGAGDGWANGSGTNFEGLTFFDIIRSRDIIVIPRMGLFDF